MLFEQGKVYGGCNQQLARAVVQLPRQAAAFGVTQIQHPSREVTQLLFCLFRPVISLWTCSQRCCPDASLLLENRHATSTRFPSRAVCVNSPSHCPCPEIFFSISCSAVEYCVCKSVSGDLPRTSLLAHP